MKKGIVWLVAIYVLLFAGSSFSQQKSRRPICKKAVFAVLKPLPELTYDCPTDVLTESDDRILKTPDRIQSIKVVIGELEAFTNPQWWQASVDDLNACYRRGEPGLLSREEREKFTSKEYQPHLLGNHQIRLIVVPDPCYQTYFNGANAYLLYRQGAKVHVTQVLDGYYSRLSHSLFLHLTGPPSAPLIEIEYVNISAMRPEYSAYYFVIDKATKKAVEKKSGSRRPAKAQR